MLRKCSSTLHDISTDCTGNDGWYLSIHRRDMLVVLPSNGKFVIVTSKAHGNHPSLVLPLFLCDRHKPVDPPLQCSSAVEDSASGPFGGGIQPVGTLAENVCDNI
jgi:hypothetical protein